MHVLPKIITVITSICICFFGLFMTFYSKRIRDFQVRSNRKRANAMAEFLRGLMQENWYLFSLKFTGILMFLCGLFLIWICSWHIPTL